MSLIKIFNPSSCVYFCKLVSNLLVNLIFPEHTKKFIDLSNELLKRQNYIKKIKPLLHKSQQVLPLIKNDIDGFALIYIFKRFCMTCF